MFLLERAEAEHEAAERKREATVTKATAVATLAAALIAIIAGPALDVGSLSDSATRWALLGSVVALGVAILIAALALAIGVDRGDRVSRRELDNWTTDEFRTADLPKHLHDFTEMFVEAAHNIRDANERAEARLNVAAWALGIGLVVLAIAFLVEIA